MLRSAVLPALFLLLPLHAASGDVSSTFGADANGWRVVAYPFRSHTPSPTTSAVTFDAAVGNPAGSLRIADVYGETGVTAPAEYLGDLSAYYGGTLSYDIFLRYTDGVTYPAVVLNAGTRSLYYDTPSPPLNTWSPRSIPLIEGGWRVSGSHQLATAADLVSVLMNLQGLYIYTEWHSGPDDTNVDNVRLAAGACNFVPDFDHDCDVDAHDLALFESCDTGPAVPYTLHVRPAECGLPPQVGGLLPADFNGDADIDETDFGIFQRCLSGAGKPADPNCAD